jgi:hypothetical protein
MLHLRKPDVYAIENMSNSLINLISTSYEKHRKKPDSLPQLWRNN